MKHPVLLFSLLFVFLVSACGYQIRGSANLPDSVRKIHVRATNAGSPFVREVQVAVASNGGELVFSRDQADAVLDITRDDMRRRVLTVSDRSRVQEFMLDYNVEFRMTDASGKVIVPVQRLELHQAYRFSETQVLGKSGEEDMLRTELYREMAALVIDRIAANTGSS